MIYKSFLKRGFDLIFASLFLFILSPIFFVLALFVYSSLGRPIIFKQKRPGQNEKLFTIYKFRTMKELSNQEGKVLSDEERTTTSGKFLRRTSLDELPELVNILKGEMSFVGPRPLLCEYLPLYNKEQKQRHLLKPGLTGLAQVNGRNEISWEKRFDYDLNYIENISFWLDLKILAKTLWLVLSGHGINASDAAIMKKFEGANIINNGN